MITIHEAKAADFSTLGLGALLPSECTVRERAGGMYELKIVHPITSDMRHDRIKPMRIIKAPAPVRETPQVEIGQSGSVTRSIYKVVTDGRRLYLRVKPDQESKGLHAYKPGTEVAAVELSADGKWRRVIILDGGATGWMWAGNLEYVRTETETIAGDTPGTVVQPRQTRDQLFRIYFYSPDTKTRTITAEARHITYDLAGAVVDGEYSPENVPANQVCAQIMARADHDVSDFHIYCTVSTPISGEYGGRNILDCLLDPETGVVAQTKARIVRDNYDIFILPDEVRSRGVELRYGKNLLSAYMDTDTSNTITRIKPVGKTRDGEKLYIEENGGWVESPYINDYPVVYSKEVEYDVVESDELPIEQARASLKEKAEADFAAGCDMASVKLDADFARLELTDDYRHLANQYALHLYDSVPVIDREADIVATARMTEYVYDSILDQYQDTGLGELEEVKSTIYGYELATGSVSGGKLIPNTVNGDRLQNLSVSYGKFDLAAIKHLSADAITAVKATIRELVAGNITTDQLYADLAVIAAAQITAANIEKANIQWAEIKNLSAEIAKVVNAEIKNAKIDTAQIKNLTAAVAVIVKAEIALAEIDWAHIKNVEVDSAQIKLGAITSALIAAGAIGTAQIADGSITEAKIVSLNADVIKSGTLSTDRLLIKGAGGLFYEINATAGGLTSTQLTEEQYKNAISGTALVARSVTADKIAAKTITANEILSGTITAAEIDVVNLFASAATIAALDNYILRTQTIESLKGALSIWAEEKIKIGVGGLQVGATNILRTDEEKISVLMGRVVRTEKNDAYNRSGARIMMTGWPKVNEILTIKGVTFADEGGGTVRMQGAALSGGGNGIIEWNTAIRTSKEEGALEANEAIFEEMTLAAGKYALSCWAWTEDTDAEEARIEWTIGNEIIIEATASREPKHFAATFQLREGKTATVKARTTTEYKNGAVIFADWKLEKGDCATDWSPHPEEFRAGSSVEITERRVKICAPETLIAIPSDDGEQTVAQFDADGLTVGRISAENVAYRYDGPSVLHVNPAATSEQIEAGDYTRSLADAVAKLNNRWIARDVVVSMAAGMVEYGAVVMMGTGGGGKISIQGAGANRAKLVGKIQIISCYNRTSITNLNVDAPINARAIDIYDASCDVIDCIVTGKGAGAAVDGETNTASVGIMAQQGAKVQVSGCEFYDVYRALYTQTMGQMTALNNKGNSMIAANRTHLFVGGTAPSDSPGKWNYAEINGGKVWLSSDVTADQGSKPTPETEPVTATYNYLYSDSYAGKWGRPSADIAQGVIRTDSSGNTAVVYGTIWFNAAAIKSALSGKSIKQASMRLSMLKGYGRGTQVSVQLYGTNTAYNGRSGQPQLTTNYGTIGATEPGETAEITIPTAAISDIASGKIQALVLKSDDAGLYKDRDYSQNYARFAGSATAENGPRLTVIYR